MWRQLATAGRVGDLNYPYPVGGQLVDPMERIHLEDV
jgi:hypothetical protein